MDAIPAGERSAHAALIHRLFQGGAVARRPMPNGFAFEFDADLLPSVARFVANERKCCPFLDFTVRLTAAAHRLELVLGGPEGTRDFLEAELLS